MPKNPAKASPFSIALSANAFREYSPALSRYLSKRVRRRDDTADLTQEIFERFLRVSAAEAIRNPLAYLFRIASHVVSDSLLKEENNVVVFDSDAVDSMSEMPSAVSENIPDRVQLAQELERALAQLPEMHQVVLLLAVRDGLSHAEVAAKTGLTISTVGLYVCEARARLRVALSTP